MRRRLVKIAIALTALAVLLILAAVWIVQSSWFYNKVRQRLIATVEDATGGRVEIGRFSFDWKQLRAEVSDITLHGTEPAGKPPLLHVAKAGVVLKIISIAKKDVDIASLDVASPVIFLTIAPDGSTNIPKPKVSNSQNTTMQTLLKAAIGRFALWNGLCEVESRGVTPFDARGRNLNVHLEYDGAAPRYHGAVSIDPLDAQIAGVQRRNWSVAANFSAEENRISIEAAKVASPGITVQVSGEVRNLAEPRATLKYALRSDVGEVQKLFRIHVVDRGAIELAGDAQYSNPADFMVTGATHIYSVALNDGKTHIANARADGALLATPKQLELHGLRYSGQANGVQIDGHVAVASLLHGHDLDLHTVDTFALGGTFHGDALLRNFEIFTANGTVAGLDIRRTVGLFSPEPLPWDGLVSGNAGIEASLKHSDQLTISGALDVSPAAEGAPVHGKIEGSYDAAADTFAVSNSTLTLPHSRGDFSGALGRSLRAHLETTDLKDFLPIFGKNAQSLPVKLANGSLTFDGTATGNIDSIEAVGHLTAMRLQYEKESVDSLTADVTASPSGVQFRNAVATRGALRAQFNVTAALNKWETEPTGAITGAATLHNAAIPDVVSALQLGAVPVSGALDVSAQVSGTFGDPKAAADLVVAKGSIQDEPFDRFSAHLAYGGRTIDLSGGQLDAGPKRVTLAASYEHTPDRFDSGLVRFHIATNSMALAQIRTVQNERPGAEGNFQLEANGVVDVAAPPAGELTLRVQDLSANITALGLHLGQQPFGDVRVTASSQSGVLQAHLESNFADSNIRGDGQWQLTGDYPGSANINFSRLDFARLNSWLSPGASETPDFTGAAEGSLRIEGAARKPKTLTAEVTIPKFQIAPAHSPTQDGQFALTNAAPIVARLANSVVTVQSAHFTGPSSDISLTGRATLEPKVALDLRASGHLDLGLVHELNRDFIASGTITTDATIRGDFSTPQINGRVQFQNAGLNVAGFSNGISNAAGSIIFAGDRATIQEFTGETGGGKIELTGFATYASGESVFRVHARASQVRVRKPEGVSTVADADLTLSGTVQRSLLSGSISIRRMAFNQESDFSSILTASAQPVETPAAQTGFLGGLGLDVQISSAPDIQVQSSLTQAVQVEANLRLRGTITNPALLGRVNITQGQLTFFGTKYQVSDGSISFYNPSKIAPVFDVDLTTKAQGIEITLTISGPLDHLTLTPSSDSSLNYNDIISLLVTGRPPTSDPALLSGQNALGPGAFQQMGASALLGQAIAAPVTGRLQRFFGVSSLRIDPTIPGIDANPAARLTLQQQVTPNITFTYITSVTTTNPQIVQVEWALNSRWSVVALREENGETGLDFYFKKKF